MFSQCNTFSAYFRDLLNSVRVVPWEISLVDIGPRFGEKSIMEMVLGRDFWRRVTVLIATANKTLDVVDQLFGFPNQEHHACSFVHLDPKSETIFAVCEDPIGHPAC